MKIKLLLVDDDEKEFIDTLAERLEIRAFNVSVAYSGKAALELLREHNYDIVILDVLMPGMDGIEALKCMKEIAPLTQIIMLTGHDTDSDTILGLEAGANDYVTKPFRFAVLLARIRAQLRTHEQSEDAVFTIGQYTFKPAQKLLIEGDGGKVRLTEKETAIMKYLYRAEQKIIGRDELLEQVWGYNSGVTTHTLETHIYRLRQKVERDPSNARLLVTESGGYKLVP